MDKVVNLLNLSPDELGDFFESIGEKRFRSTQVLKWLYQFGVTNFDDMTNLNKVLREKLKQIAEIRALEIVKEERSSDGTIKWAMRLDDGQIIESVLIPEDDRNTLCISTQVGCPVKCSFCRTGAQGFNRNLKVSEIIGQVFMAASRVGFVEKDSVKPISNIVMMGMGEPLLNTENTLKVVQILLSDFAFGLSKRRVTISTSGIAPIINKIAGRVDVALALSLHAPTDELRDILVPMNKKYKIKEVLDSVKYYLSKTNANCGRVTIEYVLLDHVNDSVEQAHQLAELLKDIPCKINLIPFNEHDSADYKKPSNNRIHKFYQVLFDYGFTVVTRSTRGDDINAACGQLAGEVNNKIIKFIEK